MNENQAGGASAEGEEKKKPNYILIAVIALAIIAVAMFFSSSNSNKKEVVTISGTVNFNGLKPQGENQVEGRIVLMQRETGRTEFSQASIEIVFQDNATWAWDQAESGKVYDLKVDLFLGDQHIKSSNTITVTAPATNQVLTLQVTLEDVPQEILDQAIFSVSGQLDINGFVPNGSIVVVFQKEKGTDDEAYDPATEEIPAVDGVAWSWNEAKPGKEYDFKAVMSFEDKIIGESDPASAVAPAENEVLRIQSIAKDPTKEEKASISGIVRISGPIADGSEVALYQKKYGTSYTEFSEFQRIPAVDNSNWKWTKAIKGEKYEVQAVLQVAGVDSSHSNQVLATAPAKDEVLAIDTNLSLKAPTGKPSVKCGSIDDTGHYNATVTYKRIDKAALYTLEVGSKPNERDVAHEIKEQTTKSDPAMEAYVKDGKKYYARYSYSGCSECDLEDKKNWSGYSPTLGFVCAAEGEQS